MTGKYRTNQPRRPRAIRERRLDVSASEETGTTLLRAGGLGGLRVFDTIHLTKGGMPVDVHDGIMQIDRHRGESIVLRKVTADRNKIVG